MAYSINIGEATGDIVITASASLTDQLSIAQDADGNIYNASGTPGYKSGYRLGSSGSESAASGMYVTGFIPCEAGQTATLKNIQLPYTNAQTNYNLCYIAVYDSSHTCIKSGYSKDWSAQSSNNAVSADGEYIDSIKMAVGASNTDISNMAYFRISATYIGSDSAIYVQ